MLRSVLSTILMVLCALMPSVAFSVPLQTYDTYTAAYPYNSRKGQFVQLMARGTGTNDMYVMEVDPTTGALPVSGNFSLTLDNDTNYGVVGADTLRTAAQIGNATGAADFNTGNYSAQTLRVVIAENQPAIDVNANVVFGYDTNYGAVGADTLRTASQIGNATGAAAFGTGTRSAQTLRVTVATDDVVPVSQSGTWNINNISGTISLPTGAATEATLLDVRTNTSDIVTNTADIETDTASIDGKLANNYGAATGAVRTASQVGNASGVADFGTGTAGAQTLRVVQASNSPQGAGRAYADSAYLSYSSTNVTTAAWVELDASTAATVNQFYVFSSCAETLELGVGAAAAETRVFLIPPGGIDGIVNLAIASGSRLSLKGLSGNCTTGQITLTGLN